MSEMKLNKYIDHTLLKQDASIEAIIQLCKEAKEYDFKSVCINPGFVKLCANELKGSGVEVCTVVGFPLGATSTQSKVFETKQALKDGATEIDMVINVSQLKAGNVGYIYDEVKALKRVCKKHILKVIIETCLLTDEEKVKACAASKAAGADFVKTSTGFSTGGATVEDIKLMRETVGPELGVKASGGVRDKETALAMIKAGATRIGASAGIKIVS